MRSTSQTEHAGPDFLCVGLQKAGTRWLYDQLRSAAGVWMPPIKELNYFNGRSFKPANRRLLESARKQSIRLGRDALIDRRFLKVFEQGMSSESFTDDWYISLFSKTGKRLSGDISPAYAALERQNVRRISELLPHANVILLVRHPVERAMSALSMRIRKGLLAEADIRLPDNVRKVVTGPYFMKHSLPSVVWRRWVEHFGESRCRFFFLDDIRTYPDRVRVDIANFIGLTEPRFRIRADFNAKANDRRYELSPESEQFLYEYYAEEISQCKELFGGAASGWKARP